MNEHKQECKTFWLKRSLDIKYWGEKVKGSGEEKYGK